jgi:two-component system invasion response regulator UvrY
MKKILLADDHVIVRKGLKQILADEYGQIQFGEAVNAIEIFRIVREKKWDILILDINMPGRNGLDVLKQIKDEKINIPVLVLSMHPEEQIAMRVLKLGGSGYLPKDAADTELVKAVNLIFSGRKYITSSLAEQLATHMEDPSDKEPHELLSDREFQTFLLIASGKSVSHIAGELSLSIPTVSTYRSRILEKMRMRTNADIAGYAIRKGLV